VPIVGEPSGEPGALIDRPIRQRDRARRHCRPPGRRGALIDRPIRQRDQRMRFARVPGPRLWDERCRPDLATACARRNSQLEDRGDDGGPPRLDLDEHRVVKGSITGIDQRSSGVGSSSKALFAPSPAVSLGAVAAREPMSPSAGARGRAAGLVDPAGMIAVGYRPPGCPGSARWAVPTLRIRIAAFVKLATGRFLDDSPAGISTWTKGPSRKYSTPTRLRMVSPEKTRKMRAIICHEGRLLVGGWDRWASSNVICCANRDSDGDAQLCQKREPTPIYKTSTSFS
jgi:hypothetical protein